MIISFIRKKTHKLNKNKWIINYNNENNIQKFFARNDINDLLTKGPVTPDHVIRIKPKPLILNLNTLSNVSKLEFNLNKAIEVMNKIDRYDFEKFVNNSTEFNPHIIFISKSEVIINYIYEKLYLVN